LFQSISYMAGALGVCVAAFYYVLNLRETNRNRRITFTNSIMQQMQSEEGEKRFIDCLNMQWTDFDDFWRKYDSRVNPENFAKRMSLWSHCESLGYLYNANLIDFDTVYNVGGDQVGWVWMKFKPIIEGYRRTDFSPNAYSNFEHLAEALISRQKQNEAGARERLERVGREHGAAQ
jgi:hypothetical protein